MWEPPDTLIEFCSSPRTRAGCFGKWGVERIRDYLRHHHEQRTLAVIWDGGEVAAVGTGAQCDKADTKDGYVRDRPDGECLFLEALIVAKPDCFLHLIGVMLGRWPHWKGLQILGRRDGKLIEYDQSVIAKFASYGWRHLRCVREGGSTDRVRLPVPVPAGV